MRDFIRFLNGLPLTEQMLLSVIKNRGVDCERILANRKPSLSPGCTHGYRIGNFLINFSGSHYAGVTEIEAKDLSASS